MALARCTALTLLLRRVEVQEAQQQFVAAVVDAHQQLAPGALLDAAVGHLALDLRDVAVARVGDRHEPGLVLVAQRQVQREVDVAHQPELRHRALRPGPGLVFGGRGSGHGTILP